MNDLCVYRNSWFIEERVAWLMHDTAGVFKRRFNPPLNFFGRLAELLAVSTNSMASCTYCFRCFESEI